MELLALVSSLRGAPQAETVTPNLNPEDYKPSKPQNPHALTPPEYQHSLVPRSNPQPHTSITVAALKP